MHAAMATSMAIFHALLSGCGVCAVLVVRAWRTLSIFAEPGVDKVQARRAEIRQPRTCVLCVSRIMGVYALALGPSHC